MGPTWQEIAIASVVLASSLLSVIIGLVANYAKSLGVRIEKAEGAHVTLEKFVLREYHTKDDIRELIGNIKSSIEAVHSRLDRAGYPRAHTEE